MARGNSRAATPSPPSGSSHTQAKKCAHATAAALSPKNKGLNVEPSASTLLNHSQQTMDEWYKLVRTKKGYASYVKSGKKWLAEWVAEDRLDDQESEESNFAGTFDSLTSQTLTVLRLLTAYKCDHQGRAFTTAEGLQSTFKHYFERYVPV
jgi:hypothetical protein